jgi:hypothetical protein
MPDSVPSWMIQVSTQMSTSSSLRALIALTLSITPWTTAYGGARSFADIQCTDVVAQTSRKSFYAVTFARESKVIDDQVKDGA